MTSSGCAAMRRELSAYLDGELRPAEHARVEDHLAGCRECRAHIARLAEVRSSLRIAEAEPAPDRTGAIMARVEGDGRRLRRRDRFLAPMRTFGVAAAVSALVVAGASLPWGDSPGDAASAREIVRRVRAAARDLTSYHATFRVAERGWHPDVPHRRFRAEVWFSAPERFRLEIDDLTAYPGPERWPENDVAFVASANAVQVREPTRCPVAALPGCPSGGEEVRTIIDLAPFDGRVVLPTDIVVPLGTLAGAGAFEVEATEDFGGRPAYRVRLEMRRAVPLVTSLQQGGSWRSFHPLDDVRLWLDRETWFPLGFDVVAGGSPDRARWAATRDYRDRAGEVLLRVRATAFDEPETIPKRFFRAPQSGLVTSGRFRPEEAPPGWPSPTDVAGLDPYRVGRTRGSVVHSYESGTTWLRVTIVRARTRAISGADFEAEEVRLGGDHFGYYRPAGRELRREIDIFGEEFSARVEGNVPRSSLLRVAASLDVGGNRLPRVIRAPGGVTIERLVPAEAVAAMHPTWLPAGYDPSSPDAALLVRARRSDPTRVFHYRAEEAEYDGVGIRIAQSPADVLPPSSGAPSAVDIGDAGRYFADRGELEWIDDGVYRSVRAPSFDLATLLRIARGMR